MTRIVLKSRVGADGILQLSIPVGTDEANREVQVTIESGPTAMSEEVWRQWVEKMAGSIADPTFRRHEQGEYQEK